MGSSPIVPNRSPSPAIASDLSIGPPLIYPSTSNPRTKSAVYSGGPKRRAKRANGGARNIRATKESVPAIKEPTAVMTRAGPARPFWVIAYPSRQVTIDATSPGMRIKMEVVEPPYIAP